MRNFQSVVKDMFLSYIDLPTEQVKIACIGGGTGLSTLLSGLKNYTTQVSAIVTMADDGGSAGRLRRLLGVPPFGDLRHCLAALSLEEEIMTKLLDYRFKGERYQRDDALGGHNFGNLLLTALTDITGDFESAIEEASRILKIKGRVLPSTKEDVHIWAETTSGDKIYGEQNIDLGKYDGDRTIKRLHLDPANAAGYGAAIEALEQADIITAGPGDLYTSIMPNLLIKDIVDAINRSKAKKAFIINIANKPFETPHYKVIDYVKAIKTHTGSNLFSYIIVNDNQTHSLPQELNYSYVKANGILRTAGDLHVIPADVVSGDYPLHHDPQKLAATIYNLLKL